ncbi:hypothetical protein C8Q74DRAFT_916704 [Fomes fomentarius]|nr:hypothetical protein C8Q74DRAFT_916704 [Fomes fomentarius]
MVVVPRSSSVPEDGKQITSPKVATGTVTGMVLGILCFFFIVVSYQLLAWPCKKRRGNTPRVPRNADIVITTLHTPSKTPRSFRNLFGLIRSKHKAKLLPLPFSPSLEKAEAGTAPDSRTGRKNALRALYLRTTRRDHTAPGGNSSHTPTSTLRERRALHSLYLNINLPSPRKRYPGTPSPISPALKRFGRVVLVDQTPPDTPISPFLSPKRPTSRLYQQLDDPFYSEWANEAPSCRTERPQDALISPWSPNEGQFPYYPYAPALNSLGEPRTPPPLYPPPPAYLPEIPFRAPGSNPATPTRASAVPRVLLRTPETPVSPIVSVLGDEIEGDIGSCELRQVRAALASTAEKDDAFVIGDDSEDGHSSTTDSDLETVSIYSDESTEHLNLQPPRQ